MIEKKRWGLASQAHERIEINPYATKLPQCHAPDSILAAERADTTLASMTSGWSQGLNRALAEADKLSRELSVPVKPGGLASQA